MFGKKKQEKNVSNVTKDANDITSGSRSTKSCGAKSSSKTTASKATKTNACGGKCKTKNSTKSCS